MLGRSRQKVTEHTIAALRPIIGILQHYHGIPVGFWQDKFVLGFLSFMLAFHRDLTSGIRLTDEDKGRAMADVFTALSNMNGLAIARNVTQLVTGNEKSTDFEKGADNAAVVAFFIVGKLKNADSNVHVIAAKRMPANGGDHDHSTISANLITLLFLKPVLERFGIQPKQFSSE